MSKQAAWVLCNCSTFRQCFCSRHLYLLQLDLLQCFQPQLIQISFLQSKVIPSGQEETLAVLLISLCLTNISMISSQTVWITPFTIISHSNCEQHDSHFHLRVKNPIHISWFLSASYSLHFPSEHIWVIIFLPFFLSTLILLITPIFLFLPHVFPPPSLLSVSLVHSPAHVSMSRRESQLLPHCSGWGQALRNWEWTSQTASTHLC